MASAFLESNFPQLNALLSGGGHGSGKVGYADYLENTHAHLLFGYASSNYTSINSNTGKGVYDYFLTALTASNPFITSGSVASGNAVFRTAYDTPACITSAITRYTVFNNIVSALAPTTDWASYLATVRTNVDSTMYTAADLTDAVDSYEAQATPTFMRSLNRFTAGMADINAVMGSAFVMGFANLERQFTQDVNDYRAKLNLQWKKDRNLLIMQGVGDVLKLVAQQLSAQEVAAKFYFDLMRAQSAANIEKTSTEIDYMMRGITWYMELFPHATNVMASIAGAAVVPRPLSPLAAFASGFISSAATFGMAGSALGPEGAIIGAIGGGLVGGIAGLLSN